MAQPSPLWPLVGLLRFLRQPGSWPRPLLGGLLSLLVVCALAGTSLWLSWPETAPKGWLAWLWAYTLPFLWALLTFLAAWFLLQPLLIGWLLEGLARRSLQEAGVPLRELSVLRGGLGSAYLLLRTLHLRLGWLIAGLLCSWVFPPVGWLIGILALGHIALLDACDICLALLGCSGRERLRLIKRQGLLLPAVSAGLSGHVLGLSVLGWPFWMPGMVVAAAGTCPRWLESETAA